MNLIDSFFSSLNMSTRLMLAGMGGVPGPQLAAAVANCGGGGVIGGYKLFNSDLIHYLTQADNLTEPDKYLGVNFIQEIIDPIRVLDQVDTVLAYPREKIYFVWGAVSDAVVRKIKSANRKIVVQLGNLETAHKVYAQGVDAIVFQNNNAGGHHLCEEQDVESILKQMRTAFPSLPILVSGGISSGADLYRWEQLGANGVMCGTLFIASLESSAHPLYKQKIIASSASDTIITKTFRIGWEDRSHRVIINHTVESNGSLPAKFIAQNNINGKKYPIPRYSAALPVANTTGDILSMALYSGTGCEHVTGELSVQEIFRDFDISYRAASTT